jgi:hypothetical protein
VHAPTRICDIGLPDTHLSDRVRELYVLDFGVVPSSEHAVVHACLVRCFSHVCVVMLVCVVVSARGCVQDLLHPISSNRLCTVLFLEGAVLDLPS